ncbi:glycosyltransferase family 39 protein [Patescibacteria group bacterium]|nr:glycosyltransferase family 39 protein [Patescibacteria group bacterium]
MTKLLNFIKNNKLEFSLLVTIILLGAIFRIYNINSSAHFGNDEGRDAVVVKNISEGKELPLLGPVAPNNRPDFHLGPVFYYLLTPFFALANLDPVGGVYLVIIFALGALWLTYYLGKNLFNKWTGLLAALLMSVNFLMVQYSRWTWNPHPVPFFTLLIILSLWKLIKGRDNYLILLAIASGVIIQLHGTALLVMPVFLFVFWLIFRPPIKNRVKLLIAIACFIVVVSFLLIYDLQNNLANSRGFLQVISQSDSSASPSLWQQIDQNYFNFRNFWQQIILNNRLQFVGYLLGLAVLMLVGYRNYQTVIKKEKNFAWNVLALWLLIPFLIFIFYKEAVPFHYFSLIYPLVFIALAAMLVWLAKQKYFSLLTYLLIILLLGTNLYFITQFLLDSRYEGNRAHSHAIIIQEQREAVDYIADQSGNEPFNFVSLPQNSYDKAYLYLLSLKNLEPSYQEEEISFVVLNPKSLTSELENDKIVESVDFGNVRVLTINND